MQYDMSFLGLGVSNWSVLKHMLKSRNGKYFVSSLNNIEQDKKEYLDKNNVPYEEGKNSDELLNTKTLMISPSVKADNKLLKEAQRLGIDIKIDIELFFELLVGNPKMLAITGTNGKTTTVEMITHIIKGSKRVFSVGNIGLSPFEIINEELNDCYLIFELSSFQIKHIKNRSEFFDISGVTNVSEDHLDWHGSYEQYKSDKLSISELSKTLLIPSELKDYYKGKKLILAYDEKRSLELFDIPENIKGEHNYLNAILAANCCYLSGFSPEFIKERLSTFKFGEYRMEVFLVKNGRTYIDDSKSTNAHSLLWALKSLDKNILLLAGAKDKGDDYSEVSKLISQKVKKTYLCGESSKRLFDSIKEGNKELFNEWGKAIVSVIDESEKGDIILFSPGGSSFDLFKNYKERGKYFKKIVLEHTQ